MVIEVKEQVRPSPKAFHYIRANLGSHLSRKSILWQKSHTKNYRTVPQS